MIKRVLLAVYPFPSLRLAPFLFVLRAERILKKGKIEKMPESAGEIEKEKERPQKER